MYADAITNGAVPDIANAWDVIAKEACEQAVALALQDYNSLMEKQAAKFPMSMKKFLKYHAEAQEAATDTFAKNVKGHSEIVKEYNQRLLVSKYEQTKISKDAIGVFPHDATDVDETKGQVFVFRARNYKSSEELCRKLFQTGLSQLSESCQKKSFKSYDEFKQGRETFVHNYQNDSKGPAKTKILDDGLQQLKSLEKQQMITFELDEAQRKIQEHETQVRFEIESYYRLLSSNLAYKNKWKSLPSLEKNLK